jgi:N-terminal half of MaoC dehydratase
VAKITFPIEASHILMFARAIGDDNPVYHDPEKAKHSEVGGIIAPPTFTAAVAQFNPDGSRPRPGEKWFGSGKGPTGRRQGPVGRRAECRTTFRIFSSVASRRCAHRRDQAGQDLGAREQARRQTVIF